MLRALGLLFLATIGSASAQPFVVDSWRFGTRESSSALTYCIDARDPDWQVAQRIATAVSAALLLQPKEFLIDADVRSADMSGEDMDDLYRVLIEHCDVFFGFKLVADAYPGWLTVTRPYYRSRYAYVTANSAWKKLFDMPFDKAIGATVGTAADLRLSQYLLATTASKRWDKYPMSSDADAIGAVQHGSIGAALVWAPALWAMGQADPAVAKLPVMAPDPLPVSTAEVGAILLMKQSFLRASIDQAIASLSADGTIGKILQDAKFPAEPVQ
jgi:polar amino acid transport system substrate-binding protein